MTCQTRVVADACASFVETARTARIGKFHGEVSDELLFSKSVVSSALGAGGRERTVGLFAEDIIHPTSRWVITLGTRFDHWLNYRALSTQTPIAMPSPSAVTYFNDRSEQAFSPRLSVLRKLTGSVSLTASVYRAFRAPTLNEPLK